jgi:hypothetical protein
MFGNGAIEIEPPMNHRLLGIVVLLSSLILGGCSLLCHHSTDSEAASPSQHYIADVVWDDCGATEHATVVTIRRKGLFSNKTDLLIMEDTHHVKLSWTDEQTLNVHCEDCRPRDIQQTNSKWRDVTVRYRLSATN